MMQFFRYGAQRPGGWRDGQMDGLKNEQKK